jgi:hypothetical protein
LHPWNNPHRYETPLYILKTYGGHNKSHKNIYFTWKQRHMYKNRYHLELVEMTYQYSTRSPKWSRHFCQCCWGLNMLLQQKSIPVFCNQVHRLCWNPLKLL